LKPGSIPAVFLDTTFLLPFFQLEIAVKDFTIEDFKEFLTKASEIHVSELSIFEAKAKLFRLSRKNAAYMEALENFGNNLTVLRNDERFVFHPYTGQNDAHFNLISAKEWKLDSFDIIILAQALEVELLITEDEEILNLRDQETFVQDPQLGKLAIRRWRELGQ